MGRRGIWIYIRLSPIYEAIYLRKSRLTTFVAISIITLYPYNSFDYSFGHLPFYMLVALSGVSSFPTLLSSRRSQTMTNYFFFFSILSVFVVSSDGPVTNFGRPKRSPVTDWTQLHK